MPRGGATASGLPRWRRSSRTSAATASWPSTRSGGLSPRLAAGRSAAGTHYGRAPGCGKALRGRRGELGAVRRAARAVANAGDGPIAGGLCQANLAGRTDWEDGPLGPSQPAGPAVRRGRTAVPAPAGGSGRGPAGNRGLAAKAPGGGSAGRYRAGEGVRAELLRVAAARVVAAAADSEASPTTSARTWSARAGHRCSAHSRRNTRNWTNWTGSGRQSPSNSGSMATSMALSPTSSSCARQFPAWLRGSAGSTPRR